MAKIVALNENSSSGKAAEEIIKNNKSNEIFFGVVGPVGAGNSQVMTLLERVCEEQEYECHPIKMSDIIKSWASAQGKPIPSGPHKKIEDVQLLQNYGDEMRSGDMCAIAVEALIKISEARAKSKGEVYAIGDKVSPDQKKRAYLIDCIRHPAETALFRRIYANAFSLIGVVCEEQVRRGRILDKYLTSQEKKDERLIQQVDAFISRDADDSEKKYGQHVSDAFYEADFFLDNTKDMGAGDTGLLEEALNRFISIITHQKVERPTIEETAMHHAHSARVRSACLSRQVGAALVDADGTIVATGTNEAPKAGGGVYGERITLKSVEDDHRCAFRETVYCSSTTEQNSIIGGLIDEFPSILNEMNRAEATKKLKKTRIGQLVEFSRAVHAEMDAILSAGRDGFSTVGSRLFVTTYPCHYCARHIVSAGVYEVQFIEPYPKSLALKLHDDAIETDFDKWVAPEKVSVRALKDEDNLESDIHRAGKVLFRPFVGVAPRMYLLAFEKTRELKNKETGEYQKGEDAWGGNWSAYTSAYPDLEAVLISNSLSR